MTEVTTRTDVVVIGAGAAGLLAARTLARAGHRVSVLEARERLGGRMLEVNDARAGAPIELGAEFVHGRPAVTHELLSEIGMAVVDTAEATFTARDGPLRRLDDDPFEVAAAVLARAFERESDESAQAAIERAVRDGSASAEQGEWTRRLVSGFDAADPSRASARAIAAEWAGDAGGESGQSRPVGGYAPLVAHLARSLGAADGVNVSLRTVVDRIVYGSDGVAVFARGPHARLEIHARYAIVTVPIGVLQATSGEDGAIVFEPPLPPATQRAIGLIANGPVVKVVLCFRTAFWETLAGGAYRGLAFLMNDGAFPTFWTQAPVRANTLVAWAGGPAAQRLAGLSDDRCIALALEEATHAFGDAPGVRAAFETGYVHNWQRDPFARGAYSYLTVGGEYAREALGTTVGKTVFFAGEATATDGEGGTVAGALLSGLRVAAAIGAAAGDRAGST